MTIRPGCFALLVVLLSGLLAAGDGRCEPVPEPAGTLQIVREQIPAAKTETAIAFACITAIGLTNWDWGSTGSFHTNSEGWFDQETGSGGADKLGHAFTSYVLTTVLTDAVRSRDNRVSEAPLTAALLTMGLMTYVELFDGYSNDHGFSYQDMVMNAGGAGLAILREEYPALKEALDFRLEYLPSGYGGGYRPFSDYSGQRYLLAIKLAGVKPLTETPLQYLELQGGYYTRGYLDAEEAAGREKVRRFYAGVGLDLSRLFFGPARPAAVDRTERYGRLALEILQVPGASFHSR